jgi:hypothetical protein
VIRSLLAFATLLAATSADAQVTYTFTGTNYTSISNYSNCTTGAGTCGTFTNSMNVSGSFTVPSLIAPSQSSKDISNQVSSWSFSDGLTTINSTDPTARVYLFFVSTDANGHISSADILVETWQSGSSPHVANTDRFSWVRITSTTEGVYNDLCTEVGNGNGLLAQPDTCTDDDGIQVYTSTASGSGAWTGGGLMTTVPTLGRWGLIGLTVLLLLCALAQLGRKRDASA